MEYKDSYGKTVRTQEPRDLWGKPINTNLQYVVTQYIDSDAEVVGIYPIYSDGLNKAEIMQVELKTNEVYTKDLEEELT